VLLPDVAKPVLSRVRRRPDSAATGPG